MRLTLGICLLACLALQPFASAQRPLRAKDLLRIRTIGDPSVSPDGNWIVYTLGQSDSVKDKRTTDIWMTDWAGQAHVQLTHSPEGESSPKFSPDGKYISFVSSRGKLDHAQVFVLDRRGGEARMLTRLKGDLGDYQWSPDGTRLLVVMRDTERPDSLKEKTRNPIVIDRVHFKQDVEGYRLPLREHLYLFDLATGKLDTLTSGLFNESSPAWSPDGRHIAFVSNRTADPDRNDNTDIWVVEAKPGAPVRQLTKWGGSDYSPAWSPDGKRIAFTRTTGTGNFLMYEQSVICTIAADGTGEPQILTAKLDRDATQPTWSRDGSAIGVVVTDDRREYLAEIRSGEGIATLNSGEYVFSTIRPHPSGAWVALAEFPDRPTEIYAVEKGVLRRLTNHQDDFTRGIVFSKPQGFTSRSKDGTLVSNILFPPPGEGAVKKAPTIFLIHGGPVGQDDFGFDVTRQILSAQGYAVCAVNYRGSSGRGLAFTKAIWADWGNKEVQDIFGAADHLVREGISDPAQLGIGGWSYGGILTNYCIASDPGRFRAAVSGAGSALQLSLFGVDQYITQFENELGYPWTNLDKYLKLSYPFLKADRIKTPTLFMTGEKDFNVPAVGSEQMYQALRVLGVPTQLVVYPGQYHGLTTPSYQVDRMQRYAGWFGKYLQPPAPVKLGTKR